MRITKVYTRTGDQGRTRLAGGEEVWKDSLRVEAYGTVDELSASIGVVRAFNVPRSLPAAARLDEELRWIQHKLFDIGGLLATAPGRAFPNMPTVNPKHIVKLEQLIDMCQKDLKPLKEFILPGGGQVASLLHQTRTVCRRAERICVRLAREEPIAPDIVRFLNRLSDACFVLARWMAHHQGESEELWQREPIGE
jgi:cob(I)alamin adenosyltransferase